MVLAQDYLATMAWLVGFSGILLGIASIILPYNKSTGRVEEEGKHLCKGVAVPMGFAGLYLFLAGLHISFVWPFEIAGGVYNVLFGGIATLGGLLLLGGAVLLVVNASLKPISYLSGVTGLYALVDAFAILQYGLTDNPFLSALGYLSLAAPSFLFMVIVHTDNKRWRRAFTAFAFLFSAAWLIQAFIFTMMHLQPS
jgi:putative membrane protein